MTDLDLQQYDAGVRQLIADFLRERQTQLSQKVSIFKPEFLQKIRAKTNNNRRPRLLNS